jgi:hypothetical protein
VDPRARALASILLGERRVCLVVRDFRGPNRGIESQSFWVMRLDSSASCRLEMRPSHCATATGSVTGRITYNFTYNFTHDFARAQPHQRNRQLNLDTRCAVQTYVAADRTARLCKAEVREVSLERRRAHVQAN